MAPMYAKDGGGEFERPRDGTHQAVCVNVFDVGEQVGFQGQPTHKIVIMWELADRQAKGPRAGKRFLVNERFTFSMSERSRLRPVVESWQGRAFTEAEEKTLVDPGYDVEQLIGRGGLLVVVNERADNGKTYTNVKSVMPLLPDMRPLEPETPRSYIPKFVQQLMGGTGAAEDVAQGPGAGVQDDEIPF
jgi:hypothetical protein